MMGTRQTPHLDRVAYAIGLIKTLSISHVDKFTSNRYAAAEIANLKAFLYRITVPSWH